LAGSVFGDANFNDYVVVEGTRDGTTWLPIAPGYDCRLYPEWEAPSMWAAPATPLSCARTP
jgi:hypothetical protein